MGRLTHVQLAEEIHKTGYKLIDDSKYTNMQSRIIIQCPKGHLIETCLADFRRASFTCPVCDKDIDFINPSAVPPKEEGVFRVIGFDQATKKFGVSVFDNNKLVYYSLYTFSGEEVSRLVKIRKTIQDIIIKCWQPDFIQMEDIQYQNGIMTYKVLAMLLGVVQECCRENDIDFGTVSPNVWRKYAGTNGKNRQEEKMLSVAMVKEKYNIKVNDDVAEAILIGRYGAMMHRTNVEMAFGQM